MAKLQGISMSEVLKGKRSAGQFKVLFGFVVPWKLVEDII